MDVKSDWTEGGGHAVSERQWSRCTERSKGFRAGRDLTIMFQTSFSICVPELMSFGMKRMCLRMSRMPSLAMLLAL